MGWVVTWTPREGGPRVPWSNVLHGTRTDAWNSVLQDRGWAPDPNLPNYLYRRLLATRAFETRTRRSLIEEERRKGLRVVLGTITWHWHSSYKESAHHHSRRRAPGNP